MGTVILWLCEDPVDDDDEELDEEDGQKREPVPAVAIEEEAGDGTSEARMAISSLSNICGTYPGHFRITSALVQRECERLEIGHFVFIEDFKEGKLKHMGFVGAPLYKWITLVDERQVHVERFLNVSFPITRKNNLFP